jgi:hypothetical protein
MMRSERPFRLYEKGHWAIPKSMTDDIHHPADAEHRSDDHQQAVEACQHAIDALVNGDLARGRSLLDEARAAVERAEHDESRTQEQRETAFDCYD